MKTASRTTKSGFVYLWKDVKRNKFYIGSHLGTLDDGYLGSNRRFLSAIQSRPESFKRRILCFFEEITSIELLKEEQRWLDLIDETELHGNKYYNEKKVAAGGDIVSTLSIEGRARHSTRSNKSARRISEQYDLDIFVAMRRLRKLQKNEKLSKHKPGEFWTGRKHREESLKKMSVSASKRGYRGKGYQTEESRKLISRNNAQSKAIETPFGRFESKEVAANVIGTTTQSLRTILNKNIDVCVKRKSKLFKKEHVGKTPREVGWYYVEQ